MPKIICNKCFMVLEEEKQECPQCKTGGTWFTDFKNSDSFLKEESQRVVQERKETGLEGLIGGLEAVIINCQPQRWNLAVEELLRYTGLQFDSAFSDNQFVTCALKTKDSADFLIRYRKDQLNNPFI